MQPTAGVMQRPALLLMWRPVKLQLLTTEPAMVLHMPAGWKEIPAQVGEALFLRERQSYMLHTARNAQLMVPSLAHYPGATVWLGRTSALGRQRSLCLNRMEGSRPDRGRRPLSRLERLRTAP